MLTKVYRHVQTTIKPSVIQLYMLFNCYNAQPVCIEAGECTQLYVVLQHIVFYFNTFIVRITIVTNLHFAFLWSQNISNFTQ